MGFTAEDVAVLELAWPEHKFESAEQVSALYDRLISRIDALPGVIAAAPVNVAPFTGATAGWDGHFVAEDRTGADSGAVAQPGGGRRGILPKPWGAGAARPRLHGPRSRGEYPGR